MKNDRNMFRSFILSCLVSWIWTLERLQQETYQRKNGNQHAKNADTIMPNVLAAFRSLLILLLVPGSDAAVALLFSVSRLPSRDCLNDVIPADMPLICKCLFNSAAATLLLKSKQKLLVLNIFAFTNVSEWFWLVWMFCVYTGKCDQSCNVCNFHQNMLKQYMVPVWQPQHF